MNTPLFWIGIRETEIADCGDLFTGSITIFGSGKNGNISYDHKFLLRYDYNQDNDEWLFFVKQEIHTILLHYPNAQFMLYYPDEYCSYGEELTDKLICQNDSLLIELLENKHRTRSWLSNNSIPILPYFTRRGCELSYSKMCQAFPGYSKFVAQEGYSCGGSGTYFITTAQDCKKYLDDTKIYSISPFIKNCISPNIHMVIYENEVLLLPPSVQLFSTGTDCFKYHGADFVMFKYLPEDIIRKVYNIARIIGERLRYAGYRGICGIDFLCTETEVYFMEINARFQSSSFLINKAMKESGINCSVQALHIDAFLNKKCTYPCIDFTVEYSFWGYSYTSQLHEQLKYIHQLHKESNTTDVICIDDGLEWNMHLEKDTYLFKSIFHGNIAALTPDFSYRLHSNISTNAFAPKNIIWNNEQAIIGKIMLLNHGVRISKEVLSYAAKIGEFNFEEFDAIDMIINNQIYINVPYCVNRSQISPFEIILDTENNFQLCYVENVIAKVDIRYVDKLSNCVTKNNIIYSDIAYMSNDRLRIYHRQGCFFKENGFGCQFCDLKADAVKFTIEDIYEVIDAYKKEANIRHYLIGGGSCIPSSDFANIINIANYLLENTNKPIYLMSIPPQNTDILLQLKEAGITEVAFNLEVYDRSLAKLYMPGKGEIALETYTNSFKRAVDLWGRNGKVRTIFIVGLESTESLLEGIEFVCKMGVSPILSLFKPIEGTNLSHLLAPSDEEIYDIYVNTLKICRKYGVMLGPACHYCEDNTLKISLQDGI